MKKINLFLMAKACVLPLVLAVFCLAQPAELCAGNTPSVDEIIKNTQSAYENAQSISADFSQTITMRSTGRQKNESGSFHFKKPLKMKWAYKEPNRKELFIDEKVSWFFMPEKKEVYRQPTSSLVLSQTAIKLLSGVADIGKDFKIAFIGADKNGYTLRLVPHENIGAKEITITVDDKTFLITRCAFSDFYGNHNALTFYNVRDNEEIPDAIFTFSTPTDVQIVDIQ